MLNNRAGASGCQLRRWPGRSKHVGLEGRGSFCPPQDMVLVSTNHIRWRGLRGRRGGQLAVTRARGPRRSAACPPGARKVFGWPKRCKVAHAPLVWEHSCVVGPGELNDLTGKGRAPAPHRFQALDPGAHLLAAALPRRLAGALGRLVVLAARASASRAATRSSLSYIGILGDQPDCPTAHGWTWRRASR